MLLYNLIKHFFNLCETVLQLEYVSGQSGTFLLDPDSDKKERVNTWLSIFLIKSVIK